MHILSMKSLKAKAVSVLKYRSIFLTFCEDTSYSVGSHTITYEERPTADTTESITSTSSTTNSTKTDKRLERQFT
jgi:hypothetical protein